MEVDLPDRFVVLDPTVLMDTLDERSVRYLSHDTLALPLALLLGYDAAVIAIDTLNRDVTIGLFPTPRVSLDLRTANKTFDILTLQARRIQQHTGREVAILGRDLVIDGPVHYLRIKAHLPHHGLYHYPHVITHGSRSMVMHYFTRGANDPVQVVESVRSY